MHLKNGIVLDDDFKFRVHDVHIDNGLIEQKSGENIDVDCTDCYIIPGLIDIHTHGAMGCDCMDLSYEAVDTVSRYLAEHGVTSFLATIMTQSKEWLERSVENIKEAKKQGVGGADIIGIYMEGPYFSVKYKGAHDEKYLRNPSCEEFEKLYKKSGNLINSVGVAPELDGAIEFIRREKERVNITVGHTDADYDEAMSAINAGANRLIHTFNAMRPFTHRSPNAIGAAFDSNIYCECICDGFHLSGCAVRLLYKVIGPERLVFITDAIRSAGMPDGKYVEFDGQEIVVKGGKSYTPDGVIAGGTSTLLECVKKAVEFGIPFETAVMAASRNPAKATGVYSDRGSITVGKRADLLILNKNLEIKNVLIGGKEIL